jgi:hypothetical protein
MPHSDSLYNRLCFRFLIHKRLWSYPTVQDLQHWIVYLPLHATLATPERFYGCNRYKSNKHRPSPCVQKVGSLKLYFRGYISVHFRCGLQFCRRKLTTLDYSNAAPLNYRGARTTPRTGLQPARYSTVTANGYITNGDRGHYLCVPDLRTLRRPEPLVSCQFVVDAALVWKRPPILAFIQPQVIGDVPGHTLSLDARGNFR